ncbi:MAG TPA: hypothetical protein VFN22_00010 [Gemmatimonadales bacterium]|nr:hypothetical protein [Gemmatimonadales bacterium]
MTARHDSCPHCGQMANGDFCSHCGAPQGETTCRGCGARLEAGVRFCRDCGTPVGAAGAPPPAPATAPPASGLAAGLLAVVLVAVVTGAVWYLGGGNRPASPPPGSPGVPAPATTDIWSLTPGERFTRLTDRIQAAVEAGDTAQVVQFYPMAEGAWDMLLPGDRTIDARFHIALLRIQVGQIERARVQLDSLLHEAPDNLMGRYLQAEMARAGGDQAAYQAAKTEFDRAWSREIASDRPEYAAHMPLLEEFHQRQGSI